MTKTKTSMISSTTLIKIIDLSADSFSIREAARILECDTATLMASKPNLDYVHGYHRKRMRRQVLLELLEQQGIKPEQGERLPKLPPAIHRKVKELRLRAGLDT